MLAGAVVYEGAPREEPQRPHHSARIEDQLPPPPVYDEAADGVSQRGAHRTT